MSGERSNRGNGLQSMYWFVYRLMPMRYFQSTKGEPLLNDGYFYLATLCNKIQEPIEDDHFIEWINTRERKTTFAL